MNFYSTFLISIFFSLSLFSQNNLKSELTKTLNSYELTQLDVNQLYEKLSVPNRFHLTTITLGESTYELELWDSGLRSRDNLVTLASGAKYEGTPPIPLKGFVKNDLGSSARITINKDFISGYIKTKTGVINLEPAWYYDDSVSKDLVVSYFNSDIKELENPGTCGVHSHSKKLKEKAKNQVHRPTKQIGDCFEVEIALAADYMMVDDFGSVNAVDNEICGILNDVQGNYDDEFADAIEYDLSDIYISDCDTCDPWSSSTNSSTLLNSFTNWAPGGFSGHDVATLWTTRNFNGSTIGVAWLGSVCTNLRYNTCEHFTGNNNLLRVLQAHELGHNWDASHDSGGGYIMSASVNNTDEWSAESMIDIEDYAANAGCFGSCSSGSPPTAGFNFEVIEECVVGEVEFLDESNLAAEWLWTFEGGTPSTSTEQNPTVIYTSSGTFDVTLEVTNPSGEDEFEWTNAVEIFSGPTAAFDFDNNELEIDFEDDSNSSSNAEFFWDFGDGNTSEEQDPTHAYFSPGTYTIVFDVEDDCGFDSVTEDIEVYDNPESEFVADNLVICSGDPVQYTDLSYGNIAEWDWEFDGGSPLSSMDENPIVIYNTPGVFTTSLEVTNPEGDDTFTIDDYITVVAEPQAGFSFSVNGSSVTFTSSSLFGTNYLWDFGDGNTSTEIMPTHIYATSGDFEVLLTVSNMCSSSTSSEQVSIELEPTAAFSTNQSTIGCADHTISFIDNSSSNPTSWNWTFPGGTPGTSTLQNPTVTYTQRGTFPVTLVSSNNFGSSTSMQSDFVTINDVPELTASFTENLLTVQFNSTPSFHDSVLWNFGDGNTSNLTNPSHTYAVAGTYTATVTATNSCGSISESFTITADLFPSANIVANTTTGCEGAVIQFSNNSSSNITSYNWNFPGGVPATSTEPNPSVTYNTAGIYDASLVVTNSAGQGDNTRVDFIEIIAPPTLNFTNNLNGNLLELVNSTPETSVRWEISDGTVSELQAWTHTFTSNGTFQVTVTVSNDCGTDTETFSVTVNSFLSAAFSANQTNGCTPFQVNYTSNSPNATNYSWSFPGGTPSTSTEANPVVIYDNPGTFDASLTVSNGFDSDVSSMSQFITVNTLAPLTYDSQQNGNVIQLSNTTPGTQTQWTISDGGTSTQPNYTHTFQENGTFTVTLLVSNSCGSEETTFTVVVDALPSAAFTANQTSGCSPLQVTFSSNTANATNINWSFPGGTPSSSTESNPTVTYNTDGVFDVSLSVSNAFGSDASTMTQLISIATLAPQSFDSEQTDNIITLNNTTANSQTLWTISDGTTSTDANYVHTFTENGTFTITLLSSNACGSEESSFDVTVDVFPESSFTTTGDVEGCIPFEKTYESTSINADEYNWSFPGGEPSISNEINPTVTYLTTGTFDVSLEVSNAFGTSQESQLGLITISDIPAVEFEIVSQDMGTISFNSTISGGNSILWDFGDGNTSTEENPTHTYEEAGTYTVMLEVTNECGTAFFSDIVVADIISDVEDLIPVDMFTLSPNPSSGEVNLIFEAPTTESLTYEVMDLTGRKIISQILERGVRNQKVIINDAGLYLFVITQNNSREVRRLVIME